MSQVRHRKVNAVAFSAQLTEHVIAPDSLAEVFVDRAETASVWVKVPFNLDEGDDYMRKIAAGNSGEDVALEMLAHYPGVSAEEQWATVMESQGADGEDEALDLFLGAAEKAVEIVAKRKENFTYRG